MGNDYYITPEDIKEAGENGISAELLTRRVYYQRWTKRRAIKEPPQAKKLTNEHFEIAQKNGISKNTVKHRVSHLGWDIEKAITTPIISRKNKYLDQARKNGINENTYYSRIEQGWTKEDASTIKTMSRKEAIKKALDTKHGRDIKVS